MCIRDRYSEGINLELGKGQILGEMGVTPTFDTEVPAEVTGQLLPVSCNASMNEEFDRFTFKSRFCLLYTSRCV